jgi:hypothetical protein
VRTTHLIVMTLAFVVIAGTIIGVTLASCGVR